MSQIENEFNLQMLRELNAYRIKIGIFFENGREQILLDSNDEETISAADALYIDENGSALRGLPSRRSVTNAINYCKNELDRAYQSILEKPENMQSILKEVCTRAEAKLKMTVDKKLRDKVECRLYKNETKI